MLTIIIAKQPFDLFNLQFYYTGSTEQLLIDGWHVGFLGTLAGIILDLFRPVSTRTLDGGGQLAEQQDMFLLRVGKWFLQEPPGQAQGDHPMCLW